MNSDNSNIRKYVIEENFQKALEQSAVPIILQNEDGDFILINKKCLDLIGYEFYEIDTFEKWMKKLHQDREAYNSDFVKRIFEEGVLQQGETEIVYTKDGKELYFEFHNSLIDSLADGKKAIITIMVDVTDKLASQRETQKLFDELEKSQILLQASLESHYETIIFSIDQEYRYINFNTFHKGIIKNTMEVI